jgi:predicted DNA-binding transcriptional regulator AlpA
MPADTTLPGPPELLTEKLIRRHFLPIGGRTLARWVSSGRFPRADISIGGKARFWKRETVEAWITERAAGAEGGSL